MQGTCTKPCKDGVDTKPYMQEVGTKPCVQGVVLSHLYREWY